MSSLVQPLVDRRGKSNLSFSSIGNGYCKSTFASRVLIGALLACHISILMWEGRADSATWDEVGHFVAGISHWSDGSFNLYRVNPPLARLIATGPVALFLKPKTDFRDRQFSRDSSERLEFQCGQDFALANGSAYFRLLTVARWFAIPFSVLGAWICFLWARELYGTASGHLAMALWAFSPSVLAYGHLITADMAAAGIGVAAVYALRSWTLGRTWGNAVMSGLLLGLAELAKTTWLILFPLCVLLWIFSHLSRVKNRRLSARQLAVIFVLSLAVINSGYCFEGTFKPLGEYRFLSHSLYGSSPTDSRNGHLVGNRFRDSLVGAMRVPLPENYVSGIDYIKMEYERGYFSTLRGELRFGGWWYYYLYAMLVKEPEGTWILGLLALFVTLFARRVFNARLREELMLMVPALAVIMLVSSQTGFNHHLRYVLPAYPFLFVWMSKLARSFTLKATRYRAVTLVSVVALIWSISSSLAIAPHSMSYFNWLSGGPKNGNMHLGNSNTDWGQDLLYLQDWYLKHGEARPIYLGYDLPLIDPKILGIDWRPLPIGPLAENVNDKSPDEFGPFPGWHVVSVNCMLDGQHRWDYFKEFTPVDWVGYTMPIYHITLEQANTMRRKYGMPLLPLTPPTTQPTPVTSETLGGTHDRDR